MEFSDYIDDVVQGEDVPENPTISIVIPPSFRGQRIDKALGSLIDDYSRSKIQQWLQSGLVQSAGEPLLPKYTVLGNEQILIAVPSDPIARIGSFLGSSLHPQGNPNPNLS